MRLTHDETEGLIRGVLITLGYDEGQCAAIVDHLMDCEFRGVSYGGVARALTIHDRWQRLGGRTARHPFVAYETATTARIDGDDEVGYLVALRASDMAIEKTRASGICLVAASNTWCSGMSSYYLERITAAGLIGLSFASVDALVAPHGSNEAHLGTNPAAIGFPTMGDPVIWDIGTSAIMLAEATLAARTGRPLDDGVAYAPDGSPTTDPVQALAGAFAAWGDHKGSGLSVMIQMLGFLAGSQVGPDHLTDHGFLMIAIDPGVFGDNEGVLERAGSFATQLRGARPLVSSVPVRLPFDGSRERRQTALDRGWVEVDELVVQRARQLGAWDLVRDYGSDQT